MTIHVRKEIKASNEKIQSNLSLGKIHEWNLKHIPGICQPSTKETLTDSKSNRRKLEQVIINHEYLYMI